MFSLLELVAEGFSFPTSLTFDDAGTTYIAEAGLPFGGAKPCGRVWKIGPDGKLYFSQRVMTNTGYVGLNAFDQGWLRLRPMLMIFLAMRLSLQALTSRLRIHWRTHLERGRKRAHLFLLVR